jgi:ABC-2 type transport system permease protein
MRAASAIIERDLRKFVRSSALLLVSLVLPLLQLIIIGYAFGGKITGVSVALVDLDRGPEALRLRSQFLALEANAKTFKITQEYTTTEAAVKAAKDGKVAAAIIIPEDYSRKLAQHFRPELGLTVDNTDPFVVTTLGQKMSELVDGINSGDVQPRYNNVAELRTVEIFPYVEYIQYLLPGSITLSIFVCCLIGGGLLYIDDKARGFHEGYLVTPISKVSLIAGMIVSGVVKATFSGLTVTVVGALLAGISSVLTWQMFGMLLLLNSLIAFSLISMISLMMVRVSDPVIPRATFGLLNTLLFFPSGAMYPIYGFPEWLKAIARVDPFTYAVHGLRSVLLKDVGWEALHGDILFLTCFSAVCCLGVVAFFPRHL